MAAFRLIRAFVLACALWAMLGHPVRADYASDLGHARAALAAGDWQQAQVAAKAAYAQARTGDGHVQAARLVAKTYHQAHAFGRAEFWLRRALLHASSPEIAAALTQELAQVRDQNPLDLRLQFSVAPNGNINNGYPGDRVMIWGRPFVLSPTARALPGVEFFAAAAIDYRIGRTSRSGTKISLGGYSRRYTLSPQSRKMAPAVDGADFARSGVDLSFTHRVRFATWPGVTTSRGWIGQSWYGGAPFTTQIGALVRQDFDVSPRTRWHLLGGAELQKIHQGSASHAKVFRLAAGVTHLNMQAARLDFSLAARLTKSPSPSLDNQYLALTGRYRLAHLPGSVNWAVLGSAGFRRFDVSPYSADGRRDRIFSVGTEAVFPGAAIFDLSPVVRLDYVLTKSDVQLFDRRSLTMRVGWRSDF